MLTFIAVLLLFLSRVVSRNDIFEEIDGTKIQSFLEALTKRPHIAGTSNNRDVAAYIYNQWKNEQKLDLVKYYEYEPLLSYPDFEDPNTVKIESLDGETEFTTSGFSTPILPEEQVGQVTWLAYSGNGTVVGEPIYANFGTKEDYDYLDQLGLNLTGKIVIIRYGRNFRGAKVMGAQKRGAAGVLIYNDPADWAPEGYDHTYPDTVYMPPTGVQRGSLLEIHGDPLTAGYPAKSYATRLDTIKSILTDKGFMPSIPVQPISYADAYHFLKNMDGTVVPNIWKGGIENITYRIGPGYKDRSMIKMKVKNRLETRKIQNVCAYWWGHTEPDRYVILGNHYDAWTYGAVDPNSATATLLELTRILSKTGVRFRRTLVFCAWDAEEYMLTGSTEWVEEMDQILRMRAVAYLNVDIAVTNNQTLTMSGTGLLQHAAANAARKVPNPRKDEVANGRATLFDTWNHLLPFDFPFDHDLPHVSLPTHGSDHAPFMHHGISILDFTFDNLTDGLAAGGNYPLYHTIYETKFLIERLMDPDHLKFHMAMTRYWLQLASDIADAHLIPLNVTHYAELIRYQIINDLVPSVYDFRIEDQIRNLINSASRFVNSSKSFYDFSSNDPNILAQMNDRLIAVERCFLNLLPGSSLAGLPPVFKHIIYGRDPEDSYKGLYFPGIKHAISKIRSEKKVTTRSDATKELKMQCSLLQQSIESAILVLDIPQPRVLQSSATNLSLPKLMIEVFAFISLIFMLKN